mgnify:CR=1 FL=1
MNQSEKRRYLIYHLLEELTEYRNTAVPYGAEEQKRLLRALFNVRPPMPCAEDFLRVQDEYLKEETLQKGITDISDLTPRCPDIYLWQGDITTLKCDAIVNAANSALLGCFCPNHGCIDNVIHTFAGVQLRLACAELMAKQGHDEPTGQAKITPAFNLPCRYVIHTVGPIVGGRLTERNCELLRSCYRSCLALADERQLGSIAFCCISTGEFHFPNKKAAEIAIQTVKDYKKETKSGIKVIFDVWKNEDYEIYTRLLGADTKAENLT